MSVEEQMLVLGKLSQVEKRLAELAQIARSGPVEVRQHEQRTELARQALQQAEQDKKETHLARARAEGDLDTNQRRLEQARKNAKRVTTESQAEASKTEIASLESTREQIEEQVFELMEHAEEVSAQIPVRKKELTAAEKELARVKASVPELMLKARRHGSAAGQLPLCPDEVPVLISILVEMQKEIGELRMALAGGGPLDEHLEKEGAGAQPISARSMLTSRE